MMSTTERLGAALSDRYRIERELGAGGMATVYLAHPHILPLFDSGEADGFLFYVMPHYMSPEQATAEKEISARRQSDVQRVRDGLLRLTRGRR